MAWPRSVPFFFFLFCLASKRKIADGIGPVDKVMVCIRFSTYCVRVVPRAVCILYVFVHDKAAGPPPHYVPFLSFTYHMGGQDESERWRGLYVCHTPEMRPIGKISPRQVSPGSKLLISPIEPMQLHYLARLGALPGCPGSYSEDRFIHITT